MSSMTPLASSRSYARAGRFQAGGSAGPVRASPRRHHSCVGRSPSTRAVALADLEQGDRVAAVPQVRRHDLEEAADQALAQDRVLARERVRDGDGPPLGALVRLRIEGSVVRCGKAFDEPRRHEGERHGLGQAGPHECLADGVAQLEWVVTVLGHRRVREDRGHLVVAAHADDLLGDVRLHGEVAAPRRHGRLEDGVRTGLHVERPGPGGHRDACPGRCRRGLDPDAGQERALLLGRDGRPEEAIDAGRPERHPGRCRFHGIRIDDAGCDGPAGPLGDETSGPVRAEARQPELLALLEAQARLGAQGIAEGRPADVDRVEDGRLDGHVGGRVADLGVGAAHDPGEADRPTRIGDEQRLGMEVADDVVERLEALARPREPDDDPTVADLRGIERMDRLAELEHHVVARVDDIADGALAGGQEAHLDPVRRWPDRHAAHPSADEPRAQDGLLDLDPQPLGDRPAALRDVERGVPKLAPGHRGHFPGEPEDRQGVAAVRLDVDIEDVVTVEVGQRGTDRRRPGRG